MKTFLAVVSDLFSFAFQAVFGSRVKETKELTLVPPATLLLKPANVEVVNSSNLVMGYDVRPSTAPLRYFVQKDKIKVFSRPVATFDGILTELNLGCEVVVTSFLGRFAEIRWQGEETAWVLKDDLTTEESEIFPRLTNGKIYLAEDQELGKLRRLIADEFATKELYLPLQDVEMVSYYLAQSRRSIPWPTFRPRLSGTWHKLLRGQKGINVGITPVAGGVMEYIDNDMGFVTYTKEVLFDNSIVIFSVGRKKEGEYLVEHLTEKDWQALRPVWISLI